MQVVQGRRAAHAMRKGDGSAWSFTTAGALREVVPPPHRLGVSNPDPCRLFADRGARLAVVFIRRESQTTCSDVVGQVDFQLEYAACSRCSTPASASRRTNLSMISAKSTVPKKPTPPIQKMETWATFPSPPETNLNKICCRHKYRSSAVLSRTGVVSSAIIATCPKSEHGIRASAGVETGRRCKLRGRCSSNRL